jgi:glycosyltransferase involved in cell wall biosynthesis
MESRGFPVVSVIIPCYKQANFLPESIESALAQTHPFTEVVVVDDGLADITADVTARYPGVICVRQPNRGIAEARNAGLRASRGEYVIFLDADDRLLQNAVEAHLRCFAEHPEAGFAVGDIDHITAEGERFYAPRWPAIEGDDYKALLKVNHVANTIAVMFRRSVLEHVGGFNALYTPAEDYEILLRTARIFPGAHHRGVVAHYRRHNANTSRKGAVMLRAMRRVMDSQRMLLEGDPGLKAAWRRGRIYWRERFGRVTAREIYIQVRQGDLIGAMHSTVTLLWHVRERLFVIPWKYGKDVVRRGSRRR